MEAVRCIHDAEDGVRETGGGGENGGDLAECALPGIELADVSETVDGRRLICNLEIH